MAIDWNGRGAICAAAALLGALLLVAAPLRAQQETDPPAVTSPAAPPATDASVTAPTARPSSESGAPETAASEAEGDPLGPGEIQSAPQPKRDDRIFGIMPNYLTVETSQNAPPLTAGMKFKLVAEGAFDPYEFAVVGLLAGINQASGEDSSYGQGGAGYGKRYAAGFADQAVGNFMTGAVFPTILREDPRYYQLGKGGVRHRAGYALSRLLITRTDEGGHSFNYSEFLGNATAAGIGLAYRDESDRNVSDWAVTFVEQIGVDALGFELKEFWPDIHRKVFHRHHRPEETGAAGAGNVSAVSASPSNLR